MFAKMLQAMQKWLMSALHLQFPNNSSLTESHSKLLKLACSFQFNHLVYGGQKTSNLQENPECLTA